MTKKFTVGDEVIEVAVDFSTTCRCGQEIDIGRADHLPGQPRMEGGIPMILHVEPYCDVYKRLDVLDYMRWLRTGVERIN